MYKALEARGARSQDGGGEADGAWVMARSAVMEMRGCAQDDGGRVGGGEPERTRPQDRRGQALARVVAGDRKQRWVMGAMRMEPVVSDMCEMDPPRLEPEEEEPRTHKEEWKSLRVRVGHRKALEGHGPAPRPIRHPWPISLHFQNTHRVRGVENNAEPDNPVTQEWWLP